MSAYQECVRLVLELLGLPNPGDAYLADVERLQAAGSEWHRLHAAEFGFLQLDLPDLLRGGALVTGNLSNAERFGWTRNEAARHFVRFIDEHSGRQATLLMFQIVMFLQEAHAAAPVNASGGAA